MGLWLLSYTERNVALIIEAESLNSRAAARRRGWALPGERCSTKDFQLIPSSQVEFRQISLGGNSPEMTQVIYLRP